MHIYVCIKIKITKHRVDATNFIQIFPVRIQVEQHAYENEPKKKQYHKICYIG